MGGFDDAHRSNRSYPRLPQDLFHGGPQLLGQDWLDQETGRMVPVNAVDGFLLA
jgi:hypothetical protein